jgi:formylglycine-generating enzyme required for sulfatase activity
MNESQQNDSRYPYKYAWDYLRGICEGNVSRSDVAKMMQFVGQLLGIDHEELAIKIADYAQANPHDAQVLLDNALRRINKQDITGTTIPIQSIPEVITIELPGGVGLEMVSIPKGSFLMGSPEGELDRSSDEGPQHQVTIAPFLMGKYPVTQAQWRAVASLPEVEREVDADPSDFKNDKCPVEQVSWHEALEFCARLSKLTGKPYTLPSEAQWEYACRASTTTPFYFGETITTDLANYDGDYSYGSGSTGVYRAELTEVGSFPPNAFGLYDMHGNVVEWCLDVWHGSYDRAPVDGTAWMTGGASEVRVHRGGAWDDEPKYCRSAYRSSDWSNAREAFNGFRIVSLLN